MENKRNEIQISMSSKLKELMKLASEYDELGGQASFIGILNFDDDEQIQSAINGEFMKLASIVGSNDDLMQIVVASHIIQDLPEMEDE